MLFVLRMNHGEDVICLLQNKERKISELADEKLNYMDVGKCIIISLKQRDSYYDLLK